MGEVIFKAELGSAFSTPIMLIEVGVGITSVGKIDSDGRKDNEEAVVLTLCSIPDVAKLDVIAIKEAKENFEEVEITIDNEFT